MSDPNDQGRRVEQLRRLEQAAQGRPDAMVAVARQYAAAGEKAAAIDLAARALKLTPADGETATLAAELLSDGVPTWHFGLLRDEARNRAYEAAIERAVRPGCKVFEIGTGSGILAMMAARAGAEVFTCESDPAVAAAARAVIAANGLSERVRVIGRPSFALDPTEDLRGPADILVSEIVSNDLLSEGVLAAHADAVARLLRPGGQVIPARGRIRVALAYDRQAAATRVGQVSGFDLAPFNRVARPYFDVRADSPRIALRSEPTDLFEFTFSESGPWPDRRRTLALQPFGDRVNGVVQWIALDLDDAVRYENTPGGQTSCWGPLFWPFAEEIDVADGQPIRVGAYHTLDRVRLWRALSGVAI
ncbi:MAG TPA: 50S ribosomal protein L11 methyltransferase [Caulobacteraceae bacterium]